MKINALSNNKFLKNILVVASGSTLAQIITIAVTPLITRVYSPEEYGVLTVYTSLLTILSIGVSLDYQNAIPITKSDKSAYNLITGAILILALNVILLSLIIYLLGEKVLVLLKSEVLIDYAYLIPVGVFFIGLYSIIYNWSLRIKDFKTIAQTSITQSIFSNLAKLLLGILGTGSVGLLIGQIIGQSGGMVRLARPLLKVKRDFIAALSMSSIKQLFIRYRNFPLYSAPSTYTYTIGNYIPLIILTMIFGPKIAGFYGLAFSIVNLPTALLANSVSQVFFSEIARIGKSNNIEIKQLLLKTSKKLALLGLFPLLLFILLGPQIFKIGFGEEWYLAGVYAQILAFIAYIHFIIFPAGRVLEIVERQRVSLIVNVFRLISIAIGFIVAINFELSDLLTIIIYSFIAILNYIVLFLMVVKIISD